ncbi:hypothetical protein L2X99_10145 [Microbacterium sp. KUDC0406]|uniref:hypothetical protein n=1 Tax=Microbacterium sp. KUDC0406 TaxID=2909588 RepID=UPI001F2C0155|nr:hypothetical protein [Microbacterium sp. KUDC0406]UJP08857.1 hypothetical protein L2X99_10145 [Microbacterium sp. KUDC0406]
MPGRERLRELQRRAYGPGGGLSAAEADELAALQDAAQPPSPSAGEGEVVGGELPSGVVERARNERDETLSGVGKGETVSSRSARSTTDRGETVSSRVARSTTTRSRRILLTVVAAASALLIGLGTGWLLFGRDTGPVLDAKQQQTWADFEASGKYDAGSIRMLGEQYGITAWYATQDDAKTECVMLTPSKQTSIGCLPTDRHAEENEHGQQMPLSTQVDFDDDEGTVVGGVVVRDVRGAPTAVLSRWDQSQTWDWTQMYVGDELQIAKNIVAETGIDGTSMQIAGYDGGTPIWMSQGEETCLYVADLGGITQQSCEPDSGDVVIELPNATYGLLDTNQGTRLTTMVGHEAPATGDAAGQTPE